LYVMLSALINLSALSVADFIAVLRAICSLTAESRKHLNFYSVSPVVCSATAAGFVAGIYKDPSGNNVSTIAVCLLKPSNRV
jgi:hypothetical protein